MLYNTAFFPELGECIFSSDKWVHIQPTCTSTYVCTLQALLFHSSSVLNTQSTCNAWCLVGGAHRVHLKNSINRLLKSWKTS